MDDHIPNATALAVVHDPCSYISRVDIGTIISQQEGFLS